MGFVQENENSCWLKGKLITSSWNEIDSLQKIFVQKRRNLGKIVVASYSNILFLSMKNYFKKTEMYKNDRLGKFGVANHL